MSIHSIAPLTFALLLLAACSSDDDSVECAGIARAGISLVVTDAVTGNRICDAIVELRDGDHVEKPTGWGDDDQCAYHGAMERAGTYTVTATVAGYATASQQVTVTRNGPCNNVDPQQVILALGK